MDHACMLNGIIWTSSTPCNSISFWNGFSRNKENISFLFIHLIAMHWLMVKCSCVKQNIERRGKAGIDGWSATEEPNRQYLLLTRLVAFNTLVWLPHFAWSHFYPTGGAFISPILNPHVPPRNFFYKSLQQTVSSAVVSKLLWSTILIVVGT